MGRTVNYSLAGKKVLVAGCRGMVGSAFMRALQREECEAVGLDRSDLDMRRQVEVEEAVAEIKPDAMIVAAARVGGIMANISMPAEFLYDNIMIEGNLIHAAHTVGVSKLLFMSSSCIYPRESPQPMNEDYLLTGKLEPTNEGYALAKIVGIKLCATYRKQYGRDYISAMPPNLFGVMDNFDPRTGHVIASIIRRAHEAKLAGAPELVVWGTGKARREFLYVDDAVDGCLFLLKNYSGDVAINIGAGADIAIRDLTELICDIVGYKGELVHDLSKPDGMPAKLMDNGRISAMGWKPENNLRQGIEKTYRWFIENIAEEETGK